MDKYPINFSKTEGLHSFLESLRISFSNPLSVFL